MRLIDGDTLWETLDDEPWYDNADRDEIALPIVAAAPTVDAVVVVRGKWGTHSDRPDLLICSVCNCGFDMWKHDPHNYCPNCGAKMDGVDDG